jgi:hypothetical protein
MKSIHLQQDVSSDYHTPGLWTHNPYAFIISSIPSTFQTHRLFFHFITVVTIGKPGLYTTVLTLLLPPVR